MAARRNRPVAARIVRYSGTDTTLCPAVPPARLDAMAESIQFHTDFYRRAALESTAAKYGVRAAVELTASDSVVVVRIEPRAPLPATESQALRDAFCNEALSETVKELRNAGTGRQREQPAACGAEPPWPLLAPFEAGAALAGGWVLESLSPIQSGSATVVLRHPADSIARVVIRRNGGAPLGVAHTADLDFLLMNGGGGTAETASSLREALAGFAAALRRPATGSSDGFLAALVSHGEAQVPGGNGHPSSTASGAGTGPVKRITPQIAEGIITFDFDDAGVSRLALFDAVLGFAKQSYVFLSRNGDNRASLQIKPLESGSADVLKALTRDLTRSLNHVIRKPPAAQDRNGLPALTPRRLDMEALLAELDAGDPATLGVGFRAERGPGHGAMRVLNIRGTGACDSECVFCIEKFVPGHRPMPTADATHDLIVGSAGEYDMLFFAAGEPTIHPKLFQYVEVAKTVGFTRFGMSSHFRTFADPRFALKTLQAGFEYFDIALHAADPVSQLDVNPIGDEGRSLDEALKGLAIVQRLADALGIRVSITHKIVVSKLNVTQLEPIFKATYDRGVRHFILQPVRAFGLAPELQLKLDMPQDEMLPYVNDLLRRTEGLGAVVKPYGFSRLALFFASHVETEQNRVKNIYGKSRNPPEAVILPPQRAEERTDGQHWVQLTADPDARYGFSSDGRAPILDSALARGLNLNYGCRMGSCGSCSARLVEGTVDQSTQIFLSDEQIQQGFVLLCQARPLSDVVVKLCTEDVIDEL